MFPRRRAAVVALSGTAVLGALVTLQYASISAMTPKVQVSPKASVSPNLPAQVQGRPTDALTDVSAIASALPATMSGLHAAATAPSLPVANCVAPLVTQTRAWSGGSWMFPSGVVVAVSAYPAGMGHKAEACASGRTMRHGDIVVSISQTRASADDDAISKAFAAHLSGCRDTSATPDQSSRNPTQPNFTGWVKHFVVNYDGGALRHVPNLHADAISLPDVPSFPHAPSGLPKAPVHPADVQAPQAPTTSSSFDARVSDPVGPGCGWAFSGMVSATTSEQDASLDEAVSQQQAAHQSALHKLADAYNHQLVGYDAAAKVFSTRNTAWTGYAATVHSIGQRWAQQGVDWTNYQNALAQWNREVSARDDFLSAQKAAQQNFDAQSVGCEAAPQWVTPPPVVVSEPGTTTTTWVQPSATSSAPASGSAQPSATSTSAAPSPVVVTVPGQVYTTQPTPTPTWTAHACPTRPAILDEAAPAVGPKPVAPNPK